MTCIQSQDKSVLHSEMRIVHVPWQEDATLIRMPNRIPSQTDAQNGEHEPIRCFWLFTGRADAVAILPCLYLIDIDKTTIIGNRIYKHMRFMPTLYLPHNSILIEPSYPPL